MERATEVYTSLGSGSNGEDLKAPGLPRNIQQETSALFLPVSSHYYCCCLVAKSCPRLCDPMDCSPQGSSVHGIPQQEYQSGLPFPPPGDFPKAGIEPFLPHCRLFLYHLSHLGSLVGGSGCSDLTFSLKRMSWRGPDHGILRSSCEVTGI